MIYLSIFFISLSLLFTIEKSDRNARTFLYFIVTFVLCFTPAFQFQIGTDYTTTNGELGIEYAELNQGRLPYYHRLDFSISKSIKLTKNSDLDMTASVTNAYNRENIFYFNRIKYERVNQLPIMPSFGISLSF